MYIYNMQEINSQLLFLGKGVTVKACMSFEDDLVLFVFAVFALCILWVGYIIMFDIMPNVKSGSDDKKFTLFGES